MHESITSNATEITRENEKRKIEGCGNQQTILPALAMTDGRYNLTQILSFHRIQTMKLIGASTIPTTTELSSDTTLPPPATANEVGRTQNENFEGEITPSSVSLSLKLVGDVAVAFAVTFAVSPFLTVVDKAIVESANGTKNILASARHSVGTMIQHPVQYLKSPTFLLMWAVYSATYSTANSFKTLEEHQSHLARRNDKPSAGTIQLGKMGIFLGTTFVNSSASILKDRAYARMFSTAAKTNLMSTPSKSFTNTTYAMWIMRDLSVIGSSFLLPDLVSKHLVECYGIDASKAQSFCQLTLPVAAQFVAGPFHFLGLDFYNRQYDALSARMSFAQKATDRFRALYHGIGPVVAARIARIAPGYGIGGVWNTKLRTAWREHLVQQHLHGQTDVTDSSGHQIELSFLESCPY
jgi:hypothetical protein